MPDHSTGPRDTIPGWEPGSGWGGDGRQQFFGAGAISMFNGLLGLQFFKEIPLPEANMNDPTKPIYGACNPVAHQSGGFIVGIQSGTPTGDFGNSGDPTWDDRKMPFHLYQLDFISGDILEYRRIPGQRAFRSFSGNDLMMDANGNLWWAEFPTSTKTGFYFPTNICQVWTLQPKPEP